MTQAQDGFVPDEPVAWIYDYSSGVGHRQLSFFAPKDLPEGCKAIPLYIATPPSPQAGEWISVGDRLPEIDQWVLARHNRGTWISGGKSEGPHTWRVLRYLGKEYGWMEFGPDHYHSEITHWHPLPPPPPTGAAA